MTDSLHRLSKREREIAERYANGQTYKAIAEALCRSPSTIRNHLNAIYQKLEIGNKAELIRLVLAQRTRAMRAEDEVGGTVNDVDERDAIETGAQAVETESREPVLQASQERRQVTLLVLELDIHERNGEPVDIELLEPSFAEFADNVRGAIEQAQGRVITQVGKRIVACLGWPTTHEDDALRATRVALSASLRAIPRPMPRELPVIRAVSAFIVIMANPPNSEFGSCRSG